MSNSVVHVPVDTSSLHHVCMQHCATVDKIVAASFFVRVFVVSVKGIQFKFCSLQTIRLVLDYSLFISMHESVLQLHPLAVYNPKLNIYNMLLISTIKNYQILLLSLLLFVLLLYWLKRFLFTVNRFCSLNQFSLLLKVVPVQGLLSAKVSSLVIKLLYSRTIKSSQVKIIS